MAKIAKVQEVAVSRLKPYEQNAKKHGCEQIEKLKDSIKEFGFLTPCLIDAEFNLIAGHGRVEAAKELGISKVPCVFIEGLTEAQRRAYILADNRLGELGEWDTDLVSDELESLTKEGFDISIIGFEIDDIVIDEIEDIETELDEGREQYCSPVVNVGEIWELGGHRLMCGDSTSIQDVKKLMGENAADLLETDPPYNVDVEGKAGKIKNDNMPKDQFLVFLTSAFTNACHVMKHGAPFYVWHPESGSLQFLTALEDAGLTLKQNLIWVKNQFVIGRQDYQWRHEPCFYGWKEGAAHYFIDMRSLTTIQEYTDINRMDRNKLVEVLESLIEDLGTVWHEKKPSYSELHPTMKPLSLIKKQIRNSSKPGDIVLDLFGGSGTTLIACEEMGRRCFMMEYDPHYADVIIRRWEEKTGGKAVQV